MSNPMSSRRCECSRSAAKPASASCSAALVVAPCDGRRRAVDPHHEQRGDEQQGGHEPEDQIDAGDGQ